jgi:hypothetical protein
MMYGEAHYLLWQQWGNVFSCFQKTVSQDNVIQMCAGGMLLSVEQSVELM